MTAVTTLDDADVAADVARQPGVRDRMNVFRAHAITRRKFRRPGRRAPELAAHHDALDIVDFELAVLERLWRLHRVASSDVLGCDKTFGDQQVFEPEQPFFVI